MKFLVFVLLMFFVNGEPSKRAIFDLVPSCLKYRESTVPYEDMTGKWYLQYTPIITKGKCGTVELTYLGSDQGQLQYNESVEGQPFPVVVNLFWKYVRTDNVFILNSPILGIDLSVLNLAISTVYLSVIKKIDSGYAVALCNPLTNQPSIGIYIVNRNVSDNATAAALRDYLTSKGFDISRQYPVDNSDCGNDF